MSNANKGRAMSSLEINVMAKYVISDLREHGTEDHELEEKAANWRIREVAGWHVSECDCQSVRDTISTMVG